MVVLVSPSAVLASSGSPVGAVADQATRAEALADPIEAAAAWERHATETDDLDALLRAARLWALDDVMRAERLYSAWLERASKEPRAPQVALERARLLARVAASAKDRLRAIKAYREIARGPGKRDRGMALLVLSEAATLIPADAAPAEQALRANLARQALAAWRRLPSAEQAKLELRDAAAAATYHLLDGEVTASSVRSVRVLDLSRPDATPWRQAARRFVRYYKAVGPTAARFDAVVAFGAPHWSLAAEARRGRFFEVHYDAVSMNECEGCCIHLDLLFGGAWQAYDRALELARSHGLWDAASAAGGMARLSDAHIPYPPSPPRWRSSDGLPGPAFISRLRQR